MPFLYTDYTSDDTRYENLFAYNKRIEKDVHYNMSETEIIKKIKNLFWDIIIYGKIGPDEYCDSLPHYDLVKTRYNKDEIAFIFGGDEIFDMTVTDTTKHHLNMFQRWIPYQPYIDYLNHYKQEGMCFVRELEL